MNLLPEPGYTLIQKYIEIFPMSPPTYYRGVKNGTQPKAVSITEGRRAIPNSEINKRIERLQTEAEVETEVTA